MRKINNILSLFIASFYLALTIGVGLKVHYCHGDLSSIVISSTSPDCECGEEGEMSCCSTQQTILQFDKDFLVKESSELQLYSDYVGYHPLFYMNIQQGDDEEHPVDLDIVEPSGPGVYILHSSLLFYG